MTSGHVLERAVPFDFAGIPVQPLPVVTENISQRISWWQGDPDSELPLLSSDRLIDQVVLVTVIHSSSHLCCYAMIAAGSIAMIWRLV